MELFIQGLRSLRDTQVISIGKKLTFLVGPNSAGKSTVLLALQKLEQEGLEFQPDLTNLYKNPNRNEVSKYQMIGVGYKTEKHKKYITTHTHVLFPESRFSFREIPSEQKIIANNNHQNSMSAFIMHSSPICKNESITFAEDFDEITHKSITKNFLNNSLISTRQTIMALPIGKHNGNYEIDKISDGGSSYRTTLLRILNVKGIDKEAESVVFISTSEINKQDASKINSAFAEIKESGMSTNSLIVDQDGVSIDRFGLYHELHNLKKETQINGKEIQRINNKIESIFASAKKIYHKSNNKNSRNKFSIKTAVISASRAIPQPIDLKYTAHGGSDQYYDIFGSAIQFDWYDSKNNKGLISDINHALADDLFIDNGYQIHVTSDIVLKRSQIILPKGDPAKGNEDPFFEEDDEIQDEDSEIISINMHKPSSYRTQFYSEITLKDFHGKVLNFDDIGSGIGYVFPILYEIFRDANKDHIIFIQQPELHLHPAMQANLTDTLIRAANDRRIIAETHSEHMILRALKRIRQTSNGSLTDPELALTPEDVAINYFEPQGDGTTRVHNIRIGADGDFLDKWPRGFFAERDQELFDE